MTRSHLLLLTLTSAFVVGAGSHRLNQQKTAPQPKLAIEIVDGHQRIPAPVFLPPSEGGAMETGPTRPLPDWKQPKGEAPLTRIRVRATMEDEAVRIKVAGVFDDSEPADAPGPKYGPVEKPIGSYLAREGETVTVRELNAVGFEPLIIKVVPYVREPEPPPLAPIPPQVTNNLKSVEVVGLLPMAELSNTYRLTVRNVTSKTIIALDVFTPHENGREGVTSESNPARPLMKPGAMHEVLVNESRGGRMTDHGFVADEPSRKVIIGTVVFDDETYEGDAKTAVAIVAGLTGRRLQFARALPLLQKALQSREQDQTGVLEQLKNDVSQLRIDPDPSVIDELRARFPELPKTYPENRLIQITMQGLKEGRESVLYQIADLEKTGRDPGSASLIWRRLNSFKEQLETDSMSPKQASTLRDDRY